MAEPRHTGEGNKELGQTDSGLSGRTPCYLSVVSSVQGSRSRFYELLTWLRGEVAGYGWKPVATCLALTDQPRQYLEVYQLPEGRSLLSTLEGLARAPNYQALTQLCRSRQMELTCGLPYDPGAGASSGREVDYPRDYFLQAILTLKPALLPRFIEVMQQVREFFFENEWWLVSASQSLTLPYRVMHLWRFGDADEVDKLMKKVTPVEQYAILDSYCESQWQRLLSDLVLPAA